MSNYEEKDLGGVKSQMGPFAIIPEWVIEGCCGKVYALAVYTILAKMADRSDSTCFPTIKHIGKKVGCSAETVRNSIKHLLSIGAIDVEYRKNDEGENTSNLYTVNQIESRGGTLAGGGGGQGNSRQTITTYQDKINSYKRARKGEGKLEKVYSARVGEPGSDEFIVCYRPKKDSS